MRATVRAVVLILVCLVVAAPASAREITRYHGRTSASTWASVRMWVQGPRDGDRFIRYMRMKLTTTCEDLTSESFVVDFRTVRMGADGVFSIERLHPRNYFRMDGVLRWGKGSGTVVNTTTRPTADGQDTQTCTTGDLTWAVHRVIKSSSARK